MLFGRDAQEIRCTHPVGFALRLVPYNAATARYCPLSIRCGHPILQRYKILATMLGLNKSLEVIDVVTARERHRNDDGMLPVGLLSRWIGVTLHRCDVCARADELRHTAVCPCCANTIPPGEQVALVGTDCITAVTRHPELLPISMTAVNRLLTLVCADCGVVQHNDHEMDGAMIWSKWGKVTILRDR